MLLRVLSAILVYFLLFLILKNPVLSLFVGMLAAYDMFVKNEKILDILKHLYGRYLGYISITLFYLYAYLCVFRNSALDNTHVLGRKVFAHATGAVTTISLNMARKSNLVMAAMMVRDFPASPVGYLHLGMEYFKVGAFDKAGAALQEGLKRGLDDPRGYYYMGLCYFNDWTRATPYYEKSIRLFPRYALSYVGLGRIHAGFSGEIYQRRKQLARIR